MYAPLLILCLRLAWPFGLFCVEHQWSPEAEPAWQTSGEIAVGLAQAHPDTVHYFVNRCYRGKALSAAFGINFHFGTLTAGHLTGLRQLLLISGDVESNPGPATETTCQLCDTSFSRKADVNQHMKVVHGEKNHQCPTCEYSTAKLSDIKSHQLKHQPSTSKTGGYNCNQCKHVAKLPGDLKRHMKKHDSEPAAKRGRYEESDEEIRKIVGRSLNHLIDRVANKEDSAPQRGLHIIELEAGGVDPEMYLHSVESRIEDYVQEELTEKSGIKLQLVLSVQFYKPLEPGNVIIRGFRSTQMTIFRATEFDFAEEYARILASIDKFTKDGSGWVILQLLSLKLHMATCQPIHGSTYKPLPKKLANKHAIINVQNNDEKCFVWSVLAQLHPANKDGQRVSKYKQYENSLNMADIDIPVPRHQIGKFEQLNDLAVNVYGFDDEVGIHPLRISKQTNKPRVHLLHYDHHYSLIKNLNKLLYSQTKYQHQKFFCPMCLIPRTTQALLDQHIELCKSKEPTKVTMPDDQKLKFTNTQRKLRQPLTIYADFECLTEQIASCAPHPNKSFTEKYQKHTPCGYGLVQAEGCGCNQEATKFKGLEVERCENPVARFLQTLMTIIIDYHGSPSKKMVGFDAVRHAKDDCHICGEKITKMKVADHCHVCGKYRGPAHNSCNQNLRLNKDVVLVFHNLRRFDGHLIMREIGTAAKLNGMEIKVVAKAMEDYISFSLVHKKEDDGKGGVKDFGYNIKFIDSVQFLSNSLEGLVNNLDRDQFKAMETEFDQESLDLLIRKGVYPYDYMDKFNRFDEKQLPSKEQFFSKLNDEHISQDDYDHARQVWEYFGIRSIGEYHDLYLKTDVLLLADVFENFRKFSMDKYGLDPCHYMTAPSLAWDACLKMTGVELELLQDPEMYLFCEAGIRGGISMISHRYAKANNPKMADYDPSKPIRFIIYLDANNLYGWAMVQKLPADGFRWVEMDKLERDWAKVDVEGSKGYFLEVDLDYPADVHDLHSDYPLAPESMVIGRLSSYCEHLKELMGLKGPPCQKLVPNLTNKRKYILHIRNLQLYLRLGMKLRKVHRVLEFNQREWMKKYIEFNTHMRARATNDFDKDLLKLMNNAVFGKTMENVRKYRNIELVTTRARFEKLVACCRFKDSCRFTDDLVGVSSLKPSTCLNKPIYCGLSVLDLSKVLMYEFHYDYILPKYEQNARLLFTDTDSLCYWVQTDDIYDDMIKDSHKFDFSGYPTSHPCYSTVNKKKVGLMKDEADSEIIEEFAGLRPKMYSIYGPKVEKKRAKGMKKRVVKRNINHQDYVNTLRSESSMIHEMSMIRSSLHDIFSVKVNKKSLCAYDDKRWLLNSVDSRAHGHYLNVIHSMSHQDI